MKSIEDYVIVPREQKLRKRHARVHFRSVKSADEGLHGEASIYNRDLAEEKQQEWTAVELPNRATETNEFAPIIAPNSSAQLSGDLGEASSEARTSAIFPISQSAGPASTSVESASMGMDLQAEKVQFSYLDHTADVIIFAWGELLEEAFSNAILGMFNYMVNISNVCCLETIRIEARGHDLPDLLYHLLDESLYLYGSRYFIGKKVYMESLQLNFTTDEGVYNENISYPQKLHKALEAEFSSESTAPLQLRSAEGTHETVWSLQANVSGEVYDPKRHEVGTEIKAITMHGLTINRNCTEDGYECFVLVDI